MLLAQLLKRRPVQTANPVEFLQQSLPHLHRVLARHTHPQQDRDQFSVGERLRAMRGKTLTRSVVILKIRNAIFGLGVGF